MFRVRVVRDVSCVRNVPPVWVCVWDPWLLSAAALRCSAWCPAGVPFSLFLSLLKERLVKLVMTESPQCNRVNLQAVLDILLQKNHAERSDFAAKMDNTLVGKGPASPRVQKLTVYARKLELWVSRSSNRKPARREIKSAMRSRASPLEKM